LGGAQDGLMAEYREAGAARCMTPPIDLMELKAVLQQTSHNGAALPSGAPAWVDAADAREAPEAIEFAGFVLWPEEKRLVGPNGAEIVLSALEGGVLLHLAATPGVVWPANAIAEAVDPLRDGDADRAVGPGFDRLRTTMAAAAGP